MDRVVKNLNVVSGGSLGLRNDPLGDLPQMLEDKLAPLTTG
jgi:hypothetical protein